MNSVSRSTSALDQSIPGQDVDFPLRRPLKAVCEEDWPAFWQLSLTGRRAGHGDVLISSRSTDFGHLQSGPCAHPRVVDGSLPNDPARHWQTSLACSPFGAFHRDREHLTPIHVFDTGSTHEPCRHATWDMRALCDKAWPCISNVTKVGE